MHPVEQPGSAIRAMPCGLEPHQYDLHVLLFRGRHAGYIPLGRRMGALRLAGRRGCRSAALRRLAVAHAPQRKIASAQSCPVRSAAVFRPYTRNPSQPAAGALAYPGRKPHRVRRAAPLLPLRPDTALSGYNRRLPPSPPGNAARGSQGPEKILMPPRSRHPPFCPMNSRSSLPCSGDRSACFRPGMPPGLSATESQTRFQTRLPLHRTLRLLYPRRFRRTPRSDVAPEGPNYPKTASERYKQFYLSIN